MQFFGTAAISFVLLLKLIGVCSSLKIVLSNGISNEGDMSDDPLIPTRASPKWPAYLSNFVNADSLDRLKHKIVSFGGYQRPLISIIDLPAATYPNTKQFNGALPENADVLINSIKSYPLSPVAISASPGCNGDKNMFWTSKTTEYIPTIDSSSGATTAVKYIDWYALELIRADSKGKLVVSVCGLYAQVITQSSTSPSTAESGVPKLI